LFAQAPTRTRFGGTLGCSARDRFPPGSPEIRAKRSIRGIERAASGVARTTGNRTSRAGPRRRWSVARRRDGAHERVSGEELSQNRFCRCRAYGWRGGDPVQRAAGNMWKMMRVPTTSWARAVAREGGGGCVRHYDSRPCNQRWSTPGTCAGRCRPRGIARAGTGGRAKASAKNRRGHTGFFAPPGGPSQRVRGRFGRKPAPCRFRSPNGACEYSRYFGGRGCVAEYPRNLQLVAPAENRMQLSDGAIAHPSARQTGFQFVPGGPSRIRLIMLRGIDARTRNKAVGGPPGFDSGGAGGTAWSQRRRQ